MRGCFEPYLAISIIDVVLHLELIISLLALHFRRHDSHSLTIATLQVAGTPLHFQSITECTRTTEPNESDQL
jgi:hypothetical protein